MLTKPHFGRFEAAAGVVGCLDTEDWAEFDVVLLEVGQMIHMQRVAPTRPFICTCACMHDRTCYHRICILLHVQ